jgi:hypothetical protein
MWSTRVVILCGHKSYFVGRIRISLGLKIQSEPVRRNPFKPKFVHPFNPWPDPLPPNIQFLLSVMSDSDWFGKSCPPHLFLFYSPMIFFKVEDPMVRIIREKFGITFFAWWQLNLKTDLDSLHLISLNSSTFKQKLTKKKKILHM